MNCKLPRISLLLAMSALGVVSSRAALLVSDDFNYSAGTLDAANGGTGWTSSWGNTYTTGTQTVSGNAPGTVVSGSATNTANPFATAGNSVTVGGGTNFRKFSDTALIGRDSNETLYFSFMLTPTAIGSGNGNIFQIKDIGNAYSHLEVGFTTGSQWALGGGYGSGGGGSGTAAAAGSGTGAGAAFALNQSFFIIGKIVTSSSGNDTTFVQIYGDSGSVSSTDNLSTSFLLNYSVNRTGAGTGAQVISFNTSGSGTAGTVDGIRIGTDYASVVSAVPEPSTYAAIFGATFLGFAILRRRRVG